MTSPHYLLDSNVLISTLRDADGLVARRLQDQDVGTLVTSAIVYAEVMRGAPLGTEPRAAAEGLFRLVPPLPFDRAAAERYLDLPFRRGSFDRLIAAHALALDLILVTANERDFVDVPGFRLENWAR